MTDTLNLAGTVQDRVQPSAAATRAEMLRSPLVWDSLGYFGSKVVPGLMGLLSVPVFIRIIGLDEYGRFAVILPVLMAVAGASSGWLAQGILRFHPASTDEGQRQVAFDRAVRGSVLGSVLVTTIALGGVLAGLHYSVFDSLTALAFCLSLLTYTVVLAKFQAQLRPTAVLRREIIRSVGGFLVPVALIMITGRKQFELLLLGQAVAYTIGFIPSLRFRDHSQPIDEDVSVATLSYLGSGREIVGQLWRFGWAVGLWLLLSQLLPVIDRWVIQKFTGYGSAGVYASLYEIAIRSFSFLMFPLTQAAHPRIMRSWNDGQFARAYEIIRSSIGYQVAIFLAVFVAVSVFAHRITALILGFDDRTAAHILPILILGGFLWQLALLLHKPLEIMQKTGTMLAGMASVVVLNFAASWLFIPRFGYQAAAYIFTLSACSYIAFTLCVTRFRAFRAWPETTPR
jgi:O-antigen/teichoic acid export membrane protein